MVERNDTADNAQGLADGEIDHVRTHRNGSAFHFRDKAREEFHLGGGDHRVADHFLDWVAAVGGIDHREFVGVLAQNFRNPPQDFCPFERQHTAPFRKRGFRRGHGGIDILGPGIGNLSERLARAGADRVDEAAGLRLVPGAAVVGAAIFRQHDRLGGSGLR